MPYPSRFKVIEGIRFHANVLESLLQTDDLVVIPIPHFSARASNWRQIEESPVTPITVPPSACPARSMFMLKR